MAPPKPRHEVVVLVEALDRATIGALQYARQLNPLRMTALHIAVDPERAKELSALWARVNVPAPLEVVDAPDRNLLATTQATIAELVRPDTEVTVLVPKRRYATLWRRVLHDNSSAGLVRALGSMDGVNVTIVPYRFGTALGSGPSRPPAPRRPRPGRPTVGPPHDLPAAQANEH